MNIKAWIEAARPKTLSAAWIPVLAGTGVARLEHLQINWVVALCALLSSLFIQVATNLINDAVDFKKGTDREDRLGPRRVTQSGMFSHKQVVTGAILCLLVATGFGIPVVLSGGLPILIVGVVSLFFAYGYTSGPFPLSYLGLGDLFVLIFFGWIAVCGSYFLQADAVSGAALLVGFQIGLLATTLIAVNNFRDVEQDRISNKKTLAVRFGKTFSRFEIIFCTLIPYVAGIYFLSMANWKLAALPLFALPLGISITKKILTIEPSIECNALLAKTGAHHMVFGLLLSAALWNS